MLAQALLARRRDTGPDHARPERAWQLDRRRQQGVREIGLKAREQTSREECG